MVYEIEIQLKLFFYILLLLHYLLYMTNQFIFLILADFFCYECAYLIYYFILF